MAWSNEIVEEVLSSDWVSTLTIDELLSIFWMPSAARSRAREIERAMEDLEARLQRPGSPQELADELNIARDEVYRSLGRIGRLKNDPLEAQRSVLDSHRDEVSPHDTLPGRHGIEPQAQVDEMRSRIADAIAALQRQERTVLTLCHALQLTLHEIGHVLALADSVIPPWYARAVLRLRFRLPDVARRAEGPRHGPASTGLRAFRYSRGTEGVWHVLVGDPPYLLTLCGQRDSLPVTHSHELPERSASCSTCRTVGDWSRPYFGPGKWPSRIGCG